MKTVYLVLALIATLVFCAWYKLNSKGIVPTTRSDSKKSGELIPECKHINQPQLHSDDVASGVKWNSSFLKHLPKNLDTTIVVLDALGNPLHFNEYIKPVFNKDAFIFQDQGVWRLQRKSKGAADTLKGDNVVARLSRWAAFQPDTVKSWRLKLNNIAHTLNQADRVIVLKSRRRLILQRKGKTMLTFHIELGKQPIGKKQFEGDGKTPEGVYDLDFKQYRTDLYHKSLLISYPNASEKLYAARHNKKPGMGLLIHGTKPNKTNARDWTNGCIALHNKDIDVLFNYVAEGTLVEIKK